MIVLRRHHHATNAQEIGRKINVPNTIQTQKASEVFSLKKVVITDCTALCTCQCVRKFENVLAAAMTPKSATARIANLCRGTFRKLLEVAHKVHANHVSVIDPCQGITDLVREAIEAYRINGIAAEIQKDAVVIDGAQALNTQNAH